MMTWPFTIIQNLSNLSHQIYNFIKSLIILKPHVKDPRLRTQKITARMQPLKAATSAQLIKSLYLTTYA